MTTTAADIEASKIVLNSKLGTRVKVRRIWNEEPMSGELFYDTCYGCYRVSDVTFVASNVRDFNDDVIELG